LWWLSRRNIRKSACIQVVARAAIPVCDFDRAASSLDIDGGSVTRNDTLPTTDCRGDYKTTCCVAMRQAILRGVYSWHDVQCAVRPMSVGMTFLMRGWVVAICINRRLK